MTLVHIHVCVFVESNVCMCVEVKVVMITMEHGTMTLYAESPHSIDENHTSILL